MSKEAMKLALEALEWEEAYTAYPSRMMTNTITALREALAEQPAQQCHTELRRLHQSEREGWRYAEELEQERKRLNEANQAMLEALAEIANVNAMDYEYQAWARAAITKGEQS